LATNLAKRFFKARNNSQQWLQRRSLGILDLNLCLGYSSLSVKSAR